VDSVAKRESEQIDLYLKVLTSTSDRLLKQKNSEISSFIDSLVSRIKEAKQGILSEIASREQKFDMM